MNGVAIVICVNITMSCLYQIVPYMCSMYPLSVDNRVWYVSFTIGIGASCAEVAVSCFGTQFANECQLYRLIQRLHYAVKFLVMHRRILALYHHLLNVGQ